LFATQTVSPVPEFEAHEFAACAVAIDAGDPPPSMGTTWMPVLLVSQAPFGAYAVTFPVPLAGSRTPSELLGRQEEMAALTSTFIKEQLVLENAVPPDVFPATDTSTIVPLAKLEREAGMRNSMRSVLPSMSVTFNPVVVASVGPLQLLATVTVTRPGRILPLGKPEPVTLT
jgi:hypothetical protein